MSLRFSPELIPKVQDGKITMQFGLWRRPRVVAGRVYVVKGVGTIRVTAVEKIDLSRLTPWEAEAAGAKDVVELRAWLKAESPNGDPDAGSGYRVRFRYIGPAKKGEEAEEETGEAEEDEGEGAVASAVVPKAVPKDLMEWVKKRSWRTEHLKSLSQGVWRNAEDISVELGIDSATTRRRMGDLRKRGLVTSHRHHGYRITPEGQGALADLVDETSEAKLSGWMGSKDDRLEVAETLKDGRWHNAAEVGEAMNLSVVSIQRRVAALRDRGLIESHRRKGYRLTEAGFEALGLPRDAALTKQLARTDTPIETEVKVPKAPSPAPPMEVMAQGAPPTGTGEGPIPSSVLEWVESRPYRRDIIMALNADDYVSASELSDLLATSVTTLHGRLKTLKDKGLVEAESRRGYRVTRMGARVSNVIQAIAMRRKEEPVGASAYLSVESPTWSTVYPAPSAKPTEPRPVMGLERRTRWGLGETCGFCHAGANAGASPGWVEAMQSYLEAPSPGGEKVTPIPCNRGVMEDPSWFLVVDRDPMAEGHCKLVCKEHVWDLLDMGQWAQRDQRVGMARDSMARMLMTSIEVVMALDERIVDVTVIAGLEHGSHLHFDLIPRYRMDLPGLRPLASSKAYYDDLSLARKRRLWLARKDHLLEVAERLRDVARKVLVARSAHGLQVTGDLGP